MLDEPTNHLDIHSVDLLVEALNKYEGSLILVSHDRYFISRIANKIWEIDNHQIREFKGSYAEWEDWKERRDKAEADAKKLQAAAPKVEKVEVKVEKAPEKIISNDAKKELQKLKNRFKQLEEKLAVLNTNKNTLENKLADPAVYGDKSKFLTAESEYKKSVEELNAANSEYEKIFEQIMEMESGM
jgi:ATP-binding cassette subfamily F protein 3